MSAIVKMHRDNIKTELAAWLGPRFCEHLFWGIRSSPYSFLLVYENEQHQPLGFICCATNISKMYKHIMLKRFFHMTLSAITKLVRPSVFKKALTAVKRPKMFKKGNFSKWQLPEAEVIAIEVHPDAQRKGIGTKLIQAAFERFRSLGHNKVRAWTREDNEQATVFYQKQRFKLLGTRRYDTGKVCVLVADLNRLD
jgi:ribosomal protein S18 acetylase RimI-like enzyme